MSAKDKSFKTLAQGRIPCQDPEEDDQREELRIEGQPQERGRGLEPATRR